MAKIKYYMVKRDKKQENVAESNKNAGLALWISEIILYLQCHPLIASVSLSVVSDWDDTKLKLAVIFQQRLFSGWPHCFSMFHGVSGIEASISSVSPQKSRCTT